MTGVLTRQGEGPQRGEFRVKRAWHRRDAGGEGVGSGLQDGEEVEVGLGHGEIGRRWV